MSETTRVDDRPRLRVYPELPSRPWLLAPPLRVVSDPGAEVLSMYTIQTREAYETLVSDGVLVGDSSLGWQEFQEAYAWMLRQMDHRLPSSTTGLLWLRPAATRELLRDTAKHARGKGAAQRPRCSGARPTQRVHGLARRAQPLPPYAPAPGETDEEWQARWTELDDNFRKRMKPYDSSPIEQWPAEVRAEIEASWETIFDPATWRPKPDLQATMRELRADDVLRAIRIR